MLQVYQTDEQMEGAHQTYAVISFPGAEDNRPFAIAPCGEKDDVECEDPANAAPINLGPEPDVIPAAAETFCAKFVHLCRTN